MKRQVYLGLDLPNVVFQDINHSGHTFRAFEARAAGNDGKGWLIYGFNSEKYGTKPNGQGTYSMLCAWPDKPKRKFKYYNSPAFQGFKTKREAESVARALNAKFPSEVQA
jgi:hypothetical protein